MLEIILFVLLLITFTDTKAMAVLHRGLREPVPVTVVPHTDDKITLVNIWSQYIKKLNHIKAEASIQMSVSSSWSRVRNVVMLTVYFHLFWLLHWDTNSFEQRVAGYLPVLSREGWLCNEM